MVQMRAQVHGDRVPAQLEALAQVSAAAARRRRRQSCTASCHRPVRGR